VNPAATLAGLSAVLSLAAGLLTLRLAKAPGSSDQRWFALVALASATYTLCNLGTTIPASPAAVHWLSRVQVGSVVVNLWGWLRFSRGFTGGEPSALERRGSWAILALAPLPLVPGAVFSPAVVDRPYPFFDVVYRQSLTTPTGDALFALLFAIGVALEVRLVRAALRRTPHAAAIAIAFGILLALAACDALATAFLLPLPFLLDSGFAAPVLAVAWIGTSRFIAAAKALEQRGADLRVEVEERTRELASAQESLLQAEKLAALGQFANGVAHEVNNPAAVVNSSLRFIAESAAAPGGRPLDPESAAALADAAAAMERITTLVRKLVDAGRIALAPTRAAAVSVCTAIAKVLDRQPATVRAAIERVGEDARDVRVALRPEALEHVLETVVANAADALPEGRKGRIAIRTELRDGSVRITVADDGVGMPADVLRRAFDPFFTTKPFGRGSGLGLPVARGLVESAGGTLWLESEPGAGTRAVIELPEAQSGRDERNGSSAS
jgi:signal transduction histidine kinase